jgi:hypothetical protein
MDFELPLRCAYAHWLSATPAMAISIRMIRQLPLLQKLSFSKEFTGMYPSLSERIAVILTSFLICKIESSGMTLAEELYYGITQL